MVFSSGYAANVGVLASLGGADVTVFSDELNHASIIDGCRLGRSKVVVYRHNDVEQLDALLAASTGRAIVVTDVVFSMDGDAAPVDALARCCVRHGAMLVLDEAHSVLGPEVPLLDGLDVVRVGTLSKTLGSLGGWVASSGPVIDLLVNRARSFIFTTALTPADASAGLAALRVVRSSEGTDLVASLRNSIDRVRDAHPSPIIPLVLGDEAAALRAAQLLLERGIFVPAIRPPTVAVGSSRLRIAPVGLAHRHHDLAAARRARGDRARAVRPGHLVAVVGTGTGVGKTWVTCAARDGGPRARGARAGPKARAILCHGVRSGARRDRCRTARGGHRRSACTSCAPHTAGTALRWPHPWRARRSAKRRSTTADLLDEIHWPDTADLGLVETVGGVRSPMTDDADSAGFVRALAPDAVLLVADAGLGTINAVRSACDALAGLPVTILLNRFDEADDLHRRNQAWLAQRDGLAVFVDVRDPRLLGAAT